MHLHQRHSGSSKKGLRRKGGNADNVNAAGARSRQHAVPSVSCPSAHTNHSVAVPKCLSSLTVLTRSESRCAQTNNLQPPPRAIVVTVSIIFYDKESDDEQRIIFKNVFIISLFGKQLNDSSLLFWLSFHKF